MSQTLTSKSSYSVLSSKRVACQKRAGGGHALSLKGFALTLRLLIVNLTSDFYIQAPEYTSQRLQNNAYLLLLRRAYLSSV